MDLERGNTSAALDPRHRLVTLLVSATIIIAALYLGREVFMPLALAGLFSFILAPIVSQLNRRGIPNVLSVFTVTTCCLLLLVALGIFLSSQVKELMTKLPTYESTIIRKIDDLRNSFSQSNAVGDISRVVGSVEQRLETVVGTSEKAASKKPLEVTVRPNESLFTARLVEWGNSLISFLVSAGLVIIYTVLLLLDRGEIRDRVQKLLGAANRRNARALEELGSRVSKYLTMQLFVNCLYAVPLALGLALIGIPGALLWGMLGGMLRFVPYLGALVGGVSPIVLAFAIDPGWSMVIWTISLVLVIELISNNVVEPKLYGVSTGLSALSLIAAATFWTLIWGPIGLFLSTPLTVCVLVLSRVSPSLRWIRIILTNEPILSDEERFNRRLFDGNAREASEIALKLVNNKVPVAASMLHPALRQMASMAGQPELGDSFQKALIGFSHTLAELRDQALEPAAVAKVAVVAGSSNIDSLAGDICVYALSEQRIRAMSVDSPDAVLGNSEYDYVVFIASSQDELNVEMRRSIRNLRRRVMSATSFCVWDPHRDAAGGATISPIYHSLEQLVEVINVRFSRHTAAAPDLP